MTKGRRLLTFRSLDEIMPEVDRLLEGSTKVGNWSLGQMCLHLATVMRRVVDLPASTSFDSSKWVGEEQKKNSSSRARSRKGYRLQYRLRTRARWTIVRPPRSCARPSLITGLHRVRSHLIRGWDS